MGRHSAPRSAGRYVGRVGALALALGIGAAVTGGTGVASADDTGTDKGAQSAPDTPSDSTTPDATTTVESPAADSDDSGAPTSDGPTVPEMKLGESNSAAASGESNLATSGDSLPEQLFNLPARVAASFLEAATAGLRAPGTPQQSFEPTRTVQNRGTVKAPVADAESERSDAMTSPDPAPAGVVRGVSEAARSEPTERTDTPEAVGHESAFTATSFTPAPQAAAVAPAPAPPVFANPIATIVRGVLSALGIAPAATGGDAPMSPMPLLLGVLQLVHREIERFVAGFAPPAATVAPTAVVTNPVNPAIAPGVPSPTDDAPTAYGNIGKWMLEPNGQISDWGGRLQGGKTLLEAVNVVIVDPNSNTPDEARWRLASAMFWSGFPAQPIHSGGFQGEIDDVVYGQRPALPLFGYSNNFFLFTNDHGRIFGPDPVETATGYVWSGSFSTEAFTFYDVIIPGHSYVSSNMARTALATQMVMSGRATYGGMVPLDNAYNVDNTSTGDHDGYAVVLVLR